MNLQSQLTLVAFLSIILLSPFIAMIGEGQDEGFTLEAEQNWDTYGVGGTCVFGTHNIFMADVDGDGVSEIVTGGFAYNTANGSRITREAPLRVWSWNAQNVTLKGKMNWNGTILCLYAADLGSDGVAEIITAGSFRNQTDSYSSCLRVWQMTNGELSLIAAYEGITINSLFVTSEDGVPEIFSIGKLATDFMNTSQLCVFKVKNNTLSLEKNALLNAANVTSANSVYVSDLDGDSNQEVIIGGYCDRLADSKGHLSIWQWSGQELTLKANQTWQLAGGSGKTSAGGILGNTIVNNVKAGDLDGDGSKEIVTGGFAYDGEKVNAQIKVWSWHGNVLTEKASQEWATDYLTEAKCLALNDVDGDGKMEIGQSGIVAAQGSFKNAEAIHDRCQLTVWSWDGTALTLQQSKDWTFNDGACAWNVASGDVDKDGVVEIVTVGCSALGDLCDPDMRIWSLPSVNSYPSYLPYAVAGVLLATGLFSIVYLIVWKKNRLST